MTARGGGVGRTVAHVLVMATLLIGLVAGTMLPAWAAVVPGRPRAAVPPPLEPFVGQPLVGQPAVSEAAVSAPAVSAPAVSAPAAALSGVDTGPARPVFEPDVERWRDLSVSASARVQRATGVRLDEDLLLALVAVESGGRPQARSAAGAVGLTQVEPATYADLQARYAELLDGRSLAQPSTNMLAGALYLAECARMLHLEVSDPASLELALDAYNAGPRATAEWVRGGSPEPLPEETIQHAARIMAMYAPRS